MPSFGTKSTSYLLQCHPSLKLVLNEAIKEVDFSIICATRSRAAQEEAFRNGFTKVHFPNSAHNQSPSVAIDFLPYPFRGWGVSSDFDRIGKFIVATGEQLKIPVRWGGDWDRDGRTSDETFRDLGHIELHPWRDFIGTYSVASVAHHER